MFNDNDTLPLTSDFHRNMVKVIDEGIQAFKDGKDSCANPYNRPGRGMLWASEMAEAWHNGWAQAYEKSKDNTGKILGFIDLSKRVIK